MNADDYIEQLQTAAVALKVRNEFLELLLKCLVNRLGGAITIEKREIIYVDKTFMMEQTTSMDEQTFNKVVIALRLK